jgi:NAD(P)H-dependent FMN reductase
MLRGTVRGMTKPLLQIVLASTRPGRVGLPVAEWFLPRAQKHGAFDVELLDLAEVGLPLLDEPNHPRLQQYVHQHTRDWSETVVRGDAYVFVMPEYNYGFNAALKNALDYLFVEWQHKPAGLISYGGVSAGLRAAQMLRQVLAALSVTTVTPAVMLPMVSALVDEERHLRPTEQIDASATTMLDELARYAVALRELRGAA